MEEGIRQPFPVLGGLASRFRMRFIGKPDEESAFEHGSKFGCFYDDQSAALPGQSREKILEGAGGGLFLYFVCLI